MLAPPPPQYSDVINRGLFDTMLLAHFKTHYQLPRSFHTVINIPRLKTLRSYNTKTLLKPTKTSQFWDSPVRPLNPGLSPLACPLGLVEIIPRNTFRSMTGSGPVPGLGAPKAGGGIVPGSPAFLSKTNALRVSLVQLCRIIG